MTTLFIIGPMSGYPNWNFHAFDAAKIDLEQRGYHVNSPADIDRSLGFNPATDHETPDFLRIAFSRNIEALCASQSAVVLPGYMASDGCSIEIRIALRIGMPLLQYPSLELFSERFRINYPKR